MAVTAQKKPARRSKAPGGQQTAPKPGAARISVRGQPEFLRRNEGGDGARGATESDAESDGAATPALPPFLRGRGIDRRGPPERERSGGPTRSVSRSFGGEDDDPGGGGADGEADAGAREATAPASGGSDVAGAAGHGGGVQHKCSACGAGLGPAGETTVQHKCSTCTDASGAQPRQSLPAGAVQAKCSACDTGPAVRGTVQLWNCRGYRQPTCKRDATPESDLVQTKCTSCDEETKVQGRGAVLVGQGESRPMRVHREAQRGLRGANDALPHRARIQAAFGRHDISSIRTRTGGEARVAASNMGSMAFASGERIAFRETPSVHLAAHEAAHTIQQRAGISLRDGVGTPGDRWERHADRVADAVAAGQSAEAILDEVTGPGTPARTPSPRAGDPASEPVQGPARAPTTDSDAQPDEAASSSEPEGDGAMVQSQITSGASRMQEPPAKRVPQPSKKGDDKGDDDKGDDEATKKDDGEKANEKAAADATRDCPKPTNKKEAGSSKSDKKPKTVNTHGYGEKTCFNGRVDKEPEKQKKPSKDAKPKEQKGENKVKFPKWEEPNDTCECHALEEEQKKRDKEKGKDKSKEKKKEAPKKEESKCKPPEQDKKKAPPKDTATDPKAPAAASGGGGPTSDPQTLAKIAEREAARDTAVFSYAEATGSLRRMSLRTRKLAKGLHFDDPERKSAPEEVDKADSLRRVRGFAQRATGRMFDVMDFAEQDIPQRLAAIAEATKSGIAGAIATQKANVTARIDAARAKANADANSARLAVVTTYVSDVVKASAKTHTAVAAIEAKYAESTKRLGKSRDQGLKDLNGLFARGRTKHNRHGEAQANAAIAVGNSRADTYEGCKRARKWKDNGFWTGCLSVRRYQAQQKAACKTSEGTAKNILRTAEQKGRALRMSRTHFRCALIKTASQSQGALDAYNEKLPPMLRKSLASALRQLGAVLEASLHSIDSQLAQTLQGLADQETTQRQAINDAGYLQQVAVEEIAHVSARALVAAIDGGLRTTEKTVSKFLGEVTAGAPPPDAKLDAALKSAEEGLETGLDELLDRVTKELEASEARLVTLGMGAARSLAGITKANADTALKVEKKFFDDLTSTKAASKAAMDQITKLQVCRAEEGQKKAVDGMTKAVTAFIDADLKMYLKAIKKIGDSYKELQTDLEGQLKRMGPEITRNAYYAADKEQAAWKDVIAIILIILVIALSIAATIFTGGLAGGPIAAILVGIVAGAVIGAVSAALIQVINNWRTGERDLTKGVGKAALAGAIGGAVGGAFAGVGNLVVGAVIREGMRLGTRAAIHVGVTLVADLGAEAVTQGIQIAYFGQKGWQLSGFGTALLGSGIGLKRGKIPVAKVRGVKLPKTTLRGRMADSLKTVRSMRVGVGDVAIGAGGTAIVEGLEYLQAQLEGREYKFDPSRAAATFAGLGGASVAGRAANLPAARPRPTAPDAPTGTRVGDPGTTTRPTGADAPDGPTVRPGEVDAPDLPGPQPRDAGGTDVPTRPKDTDVADAPVRPKDADVADPPTRPKDTDTTDPPTRPKDADGTDAPTRAKDAADADAPARPRDVAEPPGATRPAEPGATPPRPQGADAPPAPTRPKPEPAPPRRGDDGDSGPAPRPDDAAPDAPPRGKKDPIADAAPPRGEDAPTRPTEADADLVVPGATKRVALGDGSHTVAAKRTANGDPILTICSACSRMSTRLQSLADAIPEGSPARTRLDELGADVRALENRIRKGEVDPADIPGEVSALAGRIQAAAGEFPSTIGKNVGTPDFDPRIVGARERARLADQAGFSKIEPALGEPVPPLPSALEGSYRVDKNGRLSRVPPKEGKVQLTSRDGHVEVSTARARAKPTKEAEYIRQKLTPDDRKLLKQLRDTSVPKRTPEQLKKMRKLLKDSSPVDLNEGTGATLEGRRMTDAETAELQQLRDNDARTPAQDSRVRELERLQRQQDAADLLDVRNDKSKGQGERNRATEKLGELGADEFISREFPDAQKVYEGTGSGQLDRVYRDPGPPPRFIVVEAKGGSARNTSSRKKGDEQVQQGRHDYLESVLDSTSTKGGKKPMDEGLRDKLIDGLDDGTLIYLEVSQKVTSGGELGKIKAREYDIGQTETLASQRQKREAPAGEPSSTRRAAGEPPAPEPGPTTKPAGEGADPARPRAPVAGDEATPSAPRPDAADATPTQPRPGDVTDAPPAAGRERPGSEAPTPELDRAAAKLGDADTDLVAPGASKRTDDGHNVAAKRLPGGDSIVTLCSACSRMSSRLRGLADDHGPTSTAGKQLEALAKKVDALERRIDAGAIEPAEVPAAVAKLAHELQTLSSEYPATVKAALASPDFDPATVRGRERARVEDADAFRRVEDSLGEPIPPLPDALAKDYRYDSMGRISRRVPKEGKTQLTVRNGIVDVHGIRSMKMAAPEVPEAPTPRPTADADAQSPTSTPPRDPDGPEGPEGPRPAPDSDEGTTGLRLTDEDLQHVRPVKGVTAPGKSSPHLTAPENVAKSREKFAHGRKHRVPVPRDITPGQGKKPATADTQTVVDLQGKRTTRAESTVFLVDRNVVQVEITQGQLPKVTEAGGKSLPVREVGDTTKKLRVDIDGKEHALRREVHYDADRIILFRVEDKKSITGLAIDAFTVPGPVWTPASSVAFVAGAVAARKRIFLASPVNQKTLTLKNDVDPAIYAREIQLALAQGYTVRPGGPDDLLSHPSAPGDSPVRAHYVLEPPPVGQAPLRITEPVRKLFDNKASWADFPRSLPELITEFHPPPLKNRSGDLDAAANARRNQFHMETPGAAQARKASEARRAQAGGDDDGGSGGSSEGKLTHPEDPKSGLAAEGATRKVEIGKEKHDVAAKQTQDGDTKITLCSKCRELAEQLRKVAERLSGEDLARGEALRLAKQAEDLQLRADLPPEHPRSITREELTRRCNELAGEVETAAQTHQALRGIAEAQTPTLRQEYVNPYPIDQQGRLRGQTIPEADFILRAPPPPLVVQAFKEIAGFQGSLESKKQYFERLAAELNQRQGWRAQRLGDTDDGGFAWLGVANGKVLVLTPEGHVYTGDMGVHAEVWYDLPNYGVRVNLEGAKRW